MSAAPWRPRNTCSLCSCRALRPVLTLPGTPLANELPTSPSEPEELFPLGLLMCDDCRHVQTSILVDPTRLFSGYTYETSTSEVTRAHLKTEAAALIERLGGEKSIVVLEIGCNDGSFLDALAELGVSKKNLVGIEPAERAAKIARSKGYDVHTEFFTMNSVRRLDPRGPYDAIVANNVLAHVPSVRGALEGVRLLLRPQGVLMMEVSHAAEILEGAFDTIYHEHMSYHSLPPLARCLEKIDLPILRAEILENQAGRGSLRVTAGRGREREPKDERATALVADRELDCRATHPDAWDAVNDRICGVSRAIDEFFRTKPDKKICGYGAPAKLTTLEYACGVAMEKISVIADDSTWKQGRFTPGSRTPIVSPGKMLEENPDAVVVFAWNFASSIAKKLRNAGYMGEIYVPMLESGERFLP